MTIMEKKTSILFITNSFGDDTIEHMPMIAESLGLNMDVFNLFYPGCSIDQHIDYLVNDKPEYDFRYYENGEWKTKSKVTSRPYIKQRKWDYIVLQQASHFSGAKNGLNNLDKLVALIKENLIDKNTKFIWNITWAYQSNTWHPAFKDTYRSSKEFMYNGILQNVKDNIINNPSFDKIFPIGIAVQCLSDVIGEEYLYRDTFHMSQNIGRFLSGLVAIKTVFDADLTKNKYRPEGVDENMYSKLIRAVSVALNILEKMKGE